MLLLFLLAINKTIAILSIEVKKALTNEQIALDIVIGIKDKQALYTELWKKNKRLLFKIARKELHNYDLKPYKSLLSDEDIEQILFFALVTAVKYYDPDKPYKFTSYFKYSVKKEIKNLLGIAKNGLNEKNQSRKNNILFAKSLDEPLTEDEDSITLQDMVSEDEDSGRYDNMLKNIEQAEIRFILDCMLANLDEKHRQVITLYYYKRLSYPQISEIMGISTTRVNQIGREALNRLRADELCDKLKDYVYTSRKEKRKEYRSRFMWDNPQKYLEYIETLLRA